MSRLNGVKISEGSDEASVVAEKIQTLHGISFLWVRIMYFTCVVTASWVICLHANAVVYSLGLVAQPLMSGIFVHFFMAYTSYYFCAMKIRRKWKRKSWESGNRLWQVERQTFGVSQVSIFLFLAPGMAANVFGWVASGSALKQIRAHSLISYDDISHMISFISNLANKFLCSLQLVESGHKK